MLLPPSIVTAWAETVPVILWVTGSPRLPEWASGFCWQSMKTSLGQSKEMLFLWRTLASGLLISLLHCGCVVASSAHVISLYNAETGKMQEASKGVGQLLPTFLTLLIYILFSAMCKEEETTERFFIPARIKAATPCAWTVVSLRGGQSK